MVLLKIFTRVLWLTKQTVQIVWIRIVKKLSFENKQPVMVANFFFHFFFRKLEKDDASTRPLWNTIGLRTLEKRKEENRRKFFRASSSPDFQIKNEKNLHGPFCPQPYRCRWRKIPDAGSFRRFRCSMISMFQDFFSLFD